MFGNTLNHLVFNTKSRKTDFSCLEEVFCHKCSNSLFFHISLPLFFVHRSGVIQTFQCASMIFLIKGGTRYQTACTDTRVRHCVKLNKSEFKSFQFLNSCCRWGLSLFRLWSEKSSPLSNQVAPSSRTQNGSEQSPDLDLSLIHLKSKVESLGKGVKFCVSYLIKST